MFTFRGVMVRRNEMNTEVILAVMNTTILVAEIRPEKDSGLYGI